MPSYWKPPGVSRYDREWENAARNLLARMKNARDEMQAVIDNWEQGDLAGAVSCLDINSLDEAITRAEKAGIKEEELLK